MKIEYISAKNFFSVGETPIEVDFTKLGKITFITGRNYDLHESNDDDDEHDWASDDKYHNNALGKSTLAECVSYALYGDTIKKKVSHLNAIHNISKKKLEVEVIFSINDVRYRVVRTRKPDSLRLWQGSAPWDKDNEITKGKNTQTEIIKIIKMNHKTFVNVFYFGQHNDYNFLDCEAKEQRLMAENLLSLEVYNEYTQAAKDELKEVKDNVKILVIQYEKSISERSSCQDRVRKIEDQNRIWKGQAEANINNLRTKINTFQNKLQQTDTGKEWQNYEASQQQLSLLLSDNEKRSIQANELESGIEKIKAKQNSLKVEKYELVLSIKADEQEVQNNEKQILKSKNEIKNLNNLNSNEKCPVCFGIVDPNHYKHIVIKYENQIESADNKNKSLKNKLEQIRKSIEQKDLEITKLQNTTELGNTKINGIRFQITTNKQKIDALSKVKQPDLNRDELLIQQQIEQTQSQICSIEDQIKLGGPYVEIHNSAVQELEQLSIVVQEHKGKIDELEKLVPYYEYWVKGFGDEGIRSIIIEGILPALNSRIAFWMDFLMGGYLEIKFDKNLNATIKSKYGDHDYFAICGGERKRINLAISQAFSYVMMLSSGTFPSLVFLDEISDSIDQQGIKHIYKMICELSSEKQVLVITHNTKLKEMLKGMGSIRLIKKNGCTTKK